MKKVAAISLILNCVLLLLIYRWWRMPIQPRLLPLERVSAKAEQVSPGKIVTLTNTVERPLRWDQIESTDYQVYMANLRAAGCPEKTIQDIIQADVMDNYLRQRQEIVVEPVERFWEYISSGKVLDDLVEKKGNQLKALHNEKEELLRKLGVSSAEGSMNDPLDKLGASVGFLSVEKRNQIIQLDGKLFLQMREAEEMRTTNAPDGLKQIAALRESREQSFARILTPEENQQLEWRISPIGESLRERFEAFAPTEDEFLQSYDWQKDVVKQTERLSAATNNQALAELNNRNSKQWTTFFAPERQADYERSQDEGFKRFYFFTARSDLPMSTAVHLYEMNKEHAQAMNKIKQEPGLPEEDRAARLSELQQHENAVRNVLGDSHFQNFQKNNL